MIEIRISAPDGFTADFDFLEDAVVTAAAKLAADAVLDQRSGEISGKIIETVLRRIELKMADAIVELAAKLVADAVVDQLVDEVSGEAMDRLEESIQKATAVLVADEVRRQMTGRKLMRNANRIAARILDKGMDEIVVERAAVLVAEAAADTDRNIDGWAPRGGRN